jgi:ribosomal protein S8
MNIKEIDIKEKIKKIKNKIKNLPFLKKYNYDINKVVGIKDNEKYILFADKKLLRIYRGNLRSTPLINTYIPIENAIFYNFEMEKSLIEKIDLDKFIETRVYEETGVEETDKYIIKYKIVDLLKNEKKVMIETVIVSYSFIERNFDYILKESGYIDYLSFPAFSYQSLYQEKIFTPANDMFIVLLDDKIFITFYSKGELVKIVTISGGLDKIYDRMSKLNIADFDLDIFKKLLQQKGIDQNKYNPKEFIVYKELLNEFHIFADIIEEQIKKFIEIYNIENIDRVFITTKYGNVKGLDNYLTKYISIDTFDFEFYENYNLDRLPVDPLLFLGMLETHYAYKYNDFRYNFSYFLREPTFFYRPSGQFVLSVSISALIFSILPLYQYINGLIYKNKNNYLQLQISNLNKDIVKLTVKKNALEKKKKAIEPVIKKLTDDIKKDKKLISEVYKFKYSYIPKSQELTDITLFFNKNNVYIENFSYSNNQFIINVFSHKDSNIANLIEDLTNNGFNIYAKKIKFQDKKYISQIRIKE